MDGQSPPRKPYFDFGPEDWPFLFDFPNLVSFDEVLGAHPRHSPLTPPEAPPDDSPSPSNDQEQKLVTDPPSE
ncbi:MAG: hypothetical protein JW797_09190 [Bradymonadales bacterium]|nr:hypothetical protein [Bradymonadales bacterium]